MRRKLLTCLLALATIGLVGSGIAHPPAADPSNACVLAPRMYPQGLVPVLVQGTLSYIAPLGTSLPCGPPAISEWGSHAPPCPAPPFVGAAPGEYCGPVVPPGGAVLCTWVPVLNTVPTRLYVGWDLAPFDGFVNFFTGETVIYGPMTFNIPGVTGWFVANPYATSARAIAYPTNIGPYPPGAVAPGDQNLVICT